MKRFSEILEAVPLTRSGENEPNILGYCLLRPISLLRIGVTRGITLNRTPYALSEMGSVFKHVDDTALRECGGEECHLCGRSDVPIYGYFGEIVDPSMTEPDAAPGANEVDELCADCINSGRVRRRFTWEAEKIITGFAKDAEFAWAEFHKLPDAPLFLQGFDWPMCCGVWSDFTGSPETEAELPRVRQTHAPWALGPTDFARDFERDGPPESLDEISLFTCKTCGKGYFIDQFT